jgi:hypothetical protein
MTRCRARDISSRRAKAGIRRQKGEVRNSKTALSKGMRHAIIHPVHLSMEGCVSKKLRQLQKYININAC